MKNDLARVNLTVNSLSGAISALSGDVEDYKEHTSAAPNCIDGSMNEEFSSLNGTINSIKDHVEKHENQMITKLMEIDESLQKIIPMYSCGGVGGWRRVVYLDMTDPYITCPTGWQLTTHSKRTCSELVLAVSPVTQSPSLSVEETILECVVESEAIKVV